MRKRALTILTAGLLLPVLPLPALAGDAAAERIPITDPVLLERYGFEPDATNVYATPQAYEQLTMSPAERAVAQAAILEARREAIRTAQDSGDPQGPFGTGTVGYDTVNVGFDPVHSSQAWWGGVGIFCLGGAPGPRLIAVAEFDNLPHGAKLEHVDIRYGDNSAAALEVMVFRLCYPDFDDGGPTVLVLGVHETTGAADFFRFASIGPLDEDIDLQSCFYGVQVTPDTDPCPTDGGLGIRQIRAQWRRQVSPPPATATFGDVPTGHPFFQHIEALAASGITSGCGGGDFCPGNPLNRGQMAAFLAKALGLHWGEISQ